MNPNVDLDVKHAYEETTKNVKDQIIEMTRSRTPEKKEMSAEEMDVYLTEQKAEQMLIEQIHQNLIKSQMSIVVNSATAKFLVVRKEDKNFLNEYLKGCIDRAIFNENFNDFDRPMHKFDDV